MQAEEGVMFGFTKDVVVCEDEMRTACGSVVVGGSTRP